MQVIGARGLGWSAQRGTKPSRSDLAFTLQQAQGFSECLDGLGHVLLLSTADTNAPGQTGECICARQLSILRSRALELPQTFRPGTRRRPSMQTKGL